MHAVMIAAGCDFGTYPIGQVSLPGQVVTRRARRRLSLTGKCRCPGKKGIDEMTDDSAAREEENVARADELLAEELLVEEVSIDGMCGVY
jgi:mycofactocin precursor